MAEFKDSKVFRETAAKEESASMIDETDLTPALNQRKLQFNES